MGDVVNGRFIQVPCRRVLEGAREQPLTTVIVLGWKNNEDLHFASSTSDKREMLWLIEKARVALMST